MQANSEPRVVEIVEIQRPALGGAAFVTADGDVFVQTSGEVGRFPATPFSTELYPGMSGTFFLASPRGGPRVRVSLRE